MVDVRKPKFEFTPRLKAYGQLDTSNELIVCQILKGKLHQVYFPDSWEDAIICVDSQIIGKSRKHQPYQVGSQLKDPVLLGLNDKEDGYEIVYDPYDQEGYVDPQMLLNFRRKV